MAKSEKVYKVTLELCHIDRHIYDTQSVVIVQHPSETLERLSARLLAYAHCFEERLVFTRGLCVPDEPAVWLLALDNRIEHWIDVGLPEPERLSKAARQGARLTLFSYGSAFKPWYDKKAAALENLPQFTHYLLDDELLAQMAARFTRNLNLSVTISDNVLYITIDDWSGQQELKPLT